MKKRYLGVCEKITAFILAFALIFTTVLQFSAEEAKAASITITEAAGWFETAYAEWSPVSGATAYKVYVKEASASDSAYVQLDNELIRKYPNYWRADALGLKAGNYVLKIEAVTGSGSVTATTGTLKVEAHDRSGFAFASGSSAASAGIGAYNNDGTLKSNATVLYVTEENKKTVKMTIKGTEYTGVAAITQAIKDKNSCQPVAIRIIGQVTMDGLVCSDMSSAYAIGVKTASNVTFEGVGDDATLYTAGVAAFQCKSIEVRNLGLMNWGGGKDGDGVTLKGSVGVWIHNNDFFYGNAGSDGDQAKGDGSMDLKDDSQYVTISYNHFWDSGKMSLCGMKSESGENWITYHHNWFDHSDSRHPRVRTMSVHVYNNYYDGNAKYGIGVCYGGSVFAEANYFRNCPLPFCISGQGSEAGTILSGEPVGGIKAYNNVFASGVKSLIYANAGKGTAGATAAASSTSYDAYLASSRSDTGASSYHYNNFDTKVDLGVATSAIDDPSKVPEIVTAKAGRMNGGDFTWEFDDSVDDESYSLNTPLKTAINNYKTTLVSVGGGSTTTVTKYSVTVNGGSASATLAAAGTEITITATPASGQTFKNWTVVSGGVTLSSTTSATATFTMPSANVVITAVYDGSSSGGGESGSGTEGDVTSSYFNHFTGKKNNNSLYTITGSYSDTKGTVTYAGTSYSACLKMETATNIAFSTTSAGTLTLVFAEANNSGAAYVDGTKYASDANGVVTVDLAAGSHTITKANSTNLFIINFEASGSTQEHTHTYDEGVITKQPTCYQTGIKTYTCTGCEAGTQGHTKTEEIAATNNHVYSAEWTIDTPATETTPGSKSHHCTTTGCTAKSDVTVIPATGSGSSETTPSVTISFDATTLTADNGSSVTATTFGNGYIKVTGALVYKTAKDSAGNVTNNVTGIAVPNSAAAGFTVKVNGTATLVVTASSSGSAKTSSISVVSADGTAVAEKNGETSVTGGSSAKKDFTYELTTGEYTVVCPTDSATTELRVIGINGTGNFVAYEASSEPEPEADADYTAVNEALAKVPSDLSKYTDETAQAVTDAVNAVVTGKKASQQAEVDAMAQAIEDAVAALVEKFVKNGIYSGDDGNFYYYVDDVIDTTCNALKQNNDEWWLVQSGKVATDYTGFFENGAGKWYVVTGKIDITFTGLALEDGKWLCVKNGKYYPEYNGMIQNGGSWWYVVNGELDTSYSGLFTNDGGTWFVKNGKIATDSTGILTANGQFYYVVAGKAMVDYTGLVQNNGAFWYIENGTINTGYTGIFTNTSGSWYVAGGKLNTTATTVTIDGVTYTLSGGKVTGTN